MLVKFNDADEFLAELYEEAAAGAVDRKVLRTTCRFERREPFVVVSVIAAYSVAGTPTVLTCRIGEYIVPDDSIGKEVRGKADALRQKIETEGKGIGLTIRHGTIEP